MHSDQPLRLLGLGSLILAASAVQRPQVPQDSLPRPLPIATPLGLASEDLAHVARADQRAELGRRLFFDSVLSRDESIACASCHRPELGFADDVARSRGVDGQLTERNTPTLFNRVLGHNFMWRGESSSLEEQVLQPISNPLEMGQSLESVVERLRASPELSAAFVEAFGEPPDESNLAQALAAFVRRLWAGDSGFDRFRAGEREALTPQERGGMWFFQSRGQCWRCHVGQNLSDDEFHNTGIGSREGVPEDGRYVVTQEEADRGRFKTPTLRAIALTAPFMHDGSLATLEEVVQFYRDGGRPNSNLSEHLAPIEMSDEEAANLVAFLRALTPR